MGRTEVLMDLLLAGLDLRAAGRAGGTPVRITALIRLRRGEVKRELPRIGSGKEMDHAICLFGGNVRDGADEGGQRVERIPRRGYGIPAERGGSARAKRARADGAPVRQRGFVAAHHAGQDRKST